MNCRNFQKQNEFNPRMLYIKDSQESPLKKSLSRTATRSLWVLQWILKSKRKSLPAPSVPALSELKSQGRNTMMISMSSSVLIVPKRPLTHLKPFFSIRKFIHISGSSV